MSESIGLVCSRVVDLNDPKPGSVMRQCIDCKAPIWVDPGSIAKVIEHHKVSPVLICLDCAEDEITKIGLKQVVANTLEIGIGDESKTYSV